MAPEVVVPANFGKHHLKSRSHSNLELLCAEGEIKRANSMILSLNSSVIDDLIARLDITSLDMQDFGAPTVNCFVESMYSGELENCDKSNFRDLNKLGHVFNVTWFTDRCLEYFTEQVDKLTGRCYEDVLFVVEEARFVEESLKKDNFTDLVEKKLNKMRNRKSMFLKRYSSDLQSMSINQLKFVIKLTGSDVGILVHILMAHLKATGANSFTEVSRYLFKNIDFDECFSKGKWHNATNLLYEIFMDRFSEDFKAVISVMFSKNQVGQSKILINGAAKCPVLVDLELEEYLRLDINSCLGYLMSSDYINNIHQVFDAIFIWMHIWVKSECMNVSEVIERDDFLDEIINIQQERCWGKMSRQYLTVMSCATNIGIDNFANKLLDCDQLSGSEGHFLLSGEQEFNFEKLVTEKVKIVLKSEEKVVDCCKESSCAIAMQNAPIIKSTRYGANTSGFFLELCTGEEDDEECHYHDASDSFFDVHMLMGVNADQQGGWLYRPLPFNAKPVYIISRKLWNWGFYQFCDFKYSDKSSGRSCRWIYTYPCDTKIKFKALLSDSRYYTIA